MTNLKSNQTNVIYIQIYPVKQKSVGKNTLWDSELSVRK